MEGVLTEDAQSHVAALEKWGSKCMGALRPIRTGGYGERYGIEILEHVRQTICGGQTRSKKLLMTSEICSVSE